MTAGKLASKRALVTGGGTGLGIAKRFAQEGARVFITGRRQSQLGDAVVVIGDNAAVVQGGTSNLVDRVFASIRIGPG